MPIRTSRKAALFGESVIREMTRLYLDRCERLGPGERAVNLAQGFPTSPPPPR